LHKFCNFSKPVDYFAEMENPSTQKSANNLYLILLIIKSWTVILSQKYYPVLKIIREYSSSVERIQVSTHNLNNLNKLANYDVPITCTTQTRIGNSYQISLNDVLRWGIILSFEEDGWILFDIKQTSKYVTNLSHFIMFII